MTDFPAWTTVDRRVVLSARGPIREIAIETVLLPDGRIIDDYYTINLRDYALIFAEMADGAIPVLRQYKHGARRVCLAFPGGALEEGESPDAAARRELREELGCEAERWTLIGSFVTNSNQGCNTAHLFHAAGCRRVSEATSPDMERPEVLLFRKDELVRTETISQFANTSHVALLALATHPHILPATLR